MRSDPTNMYNISWMNEKEKAEHVRRDQAEWVANEALIAAWLRGDFDEEIRYSISQYNIFPTKNSLANMTRQLQAVEYAEDLCAKAQDRTVEDWDKVEEEEEGEMPEVESFPSSHVSW